MSSKASADKREADVEDGPKADEAIVGFVEERRRIGVRRGGPPVVVVGAGPTGLSAAFHLGPDAVLLEANDKIGGWCRSLEKNGFTFDYAGHIMFSNDPYVHEMYKLLLGDNVHWQDREAWIFSQDVYTRYPFQGSLYGLPAGCDQGVHHRCGRGARNRQASGDDGAGGESNGHCNGANGQVTAIHQRQEARRLLRRRRAGKHRAAVAAKGV